MGCGRRSVGFLETLRILNEYLMGISVKAKTIFTMTELTSFLFGDVMATVTKKGDMDWSVRTCVPICGFCGTASVSNCLLFVFSKIKKHNHTFYEGCGDI